MFCDILGRDRYSVTYYPPDGFEPLLTPMRSPYVSYCTSGQGVTRQVVEWSDMQRRLVTRDSVTCLIEDCRRRFNLIHASGNNVRTGYLIRNDWRHCQRKMGGCAEQRSNSVDCECATCWRYQLLLWDGLEMQTKRKPKRISCRKCGPIKHGYS